MADTVNTTYIYPPNFDGDTITPPRRWCVELLGISDGTGETNVPKIDLGNHLTPDKETPSFFVIEKIEYSCTGLSQVKLSFDRDVDELLTVLGANNEGDIDYTKYGGKKDVGVGGTGNLLLSLFGASNGNSYSIRITFRVKA